MGQNLLVVSDSPAEIELISQIVEPQGFTVFVETAWDRVRHELNDDRCAVIIADFNLIGRRAFDMLSLLQGNRSKASFILFGDRISATQVSDLLQGGAYGFISRPQLAERLADLIAGGLENRAAFAEILDMIDELQTVNDRLRQEKAALKTKNEQLHFISRLTEAVAYDLNWENIVPKMIESGFLQVCDSTLFSILYRMGRNWHVAMHLAQHRISKRELELFKQDMIQRFQRVSGEQLCGDKLIFHFVPLNIHKDASEHFAISEQLVYPLNASGENWGLLLSLPRAEGPPAVETRQLLAMVANILALSLQNAQNHHHLNAMAVIDRQTGALNRNGFENTLRLEFKRAHRYTKPLSLIMVEVNEMAAIIDRYGQSGGDFVLRELALCLRNCVRQTDYLARYAPDEFAILLPETKRGMATRLARRMSRRVERHSFVWKSDAITVDIACGISSTRFQSSATPSPQQTSTADALEGFLRQADAQLSEINPMRRSFYPILCKA